MAEPQVAPRIVFLIQGYDAPSTRIRILNLLPHFRDAGFHASVEVYPNSFCGWLRIVGSISGADILVIQKRLPSFLDALFAKRLASRIVFDFDDSVWLRHREGGTARPSRKLRDRFTHFLRRVDLAICGNPILQEYLWQRCPATASVVIPSSVPAPETEVAKCAHALLRVGWVGTAINLPYLVAIEESLIEAHARVPFELVVICSAPPKFQKFPHFRFVEWSAQTEYAEIAGFDAGIMPVADNEHSRGKCAYKALQYMRCGVPVVASDVGINREWIAGLGAGIVVKDDGWRDALVAVLSDADARERFGAAGVTAIRGGFRVEDVARQYVEAFRKLLVPSTSERA